MPSYTRPRTCKPRGICRYYMTPRGCFAGSTCKFLHGPSEQLDSQNILLTPYDESKCCIFYSKGFCRRGDQCWFKHTLNISESSRQAISQTEEDLQNEPCSICFETPTTYGLLSGCSHIFCITCIRQWRDQKGQTEHGNIKKCPMCREPSKFITPSSRFWKHGHPEKTRATEAYKDSMAKVPCRYLLQSLQRDRTRPLCPFGKDCFYRHLNDDGTLYDFDDGSEACMRQYYMSMRSSMHSLFDDFMDPASEYPPIHVNGQRLSEDPATNPTSETRSWTPTLREDLHIRRQLRILQDAMDSIESAATTSNDSVTRTLDMVRMLVQDTTSDFDFDHATDNVYRHRSNESQTEPSRIPHLSPRSLADDLETLREDYYDIPGVFNPSSSEAHSSDWDSDSEDDVTRLGRYLRFAGVSSANYGDVSIGEIDGAAMLEMVEQDPQVLGEVPPPINRTDEPQMSVIEYEPPTSEDETEQEHSRVSDPPFLTDGRGRVVWSSDRDADQ